MTTLIDKLRAAETGSPELSAEVYYHYYPNEDGEYMRYTQSIDAALTLVPEYKQMVLNHWRDEWRVDIYDGSNIASKHKSLPIAICIAVLEARK